MTKNVDYLIGTSGWSYDSWRGIFYPEKLSKKDWLPYYAQHFKVVELNATFYRFFDKDTFIKWRDTVPKGFQYVVKTPRLISHYKQLLDCEKTVKQFCKLVDCLEDRLALILLQLSPRLKYHPDRLRKTLLAFDNPKRVVIEFRNALWLTKEIYAMLREIGCIVCTVDSPEERLHDWLPTKTAYIRLHGRGEWYNYHYSKKELQNIAKFARSLVKRGATKIYIFLNNDYEAYAPENAAYLQSLLTDKKRLKKNGNL